MIDGGPTRGDPVTTREQLPAADRAHYDYIEESRGGVRGPFCVLLQSPETAGLVGRVGGYVRFESALPDATRELAILVTAREWDATYEWAAHAPLSREVGVSEDAIDVVIDDGNYADLPAEEALVVRFGRALFREKAVPDSLFEDATARFGTRGVTDLTVTMGYYGLLACVCNAFDVRPADETPIG